MAGRGRNTPSERATEAAALAIHRAASHADYRGGVCARCPIEAETALNAAHDPALGEDMSVRLGDVLDLLRGECGFPRTADRLLRSFTEDTREDSDVDA